MNRCLQKCGICVFLAALVWPVFAQTLGYGFVNFDDDIYVYENPQVLNGPALKGIEAAFTRSVDANWHPLTMLSYMLDHQLYGLNPGGYHLANIQLHILAVILLFLVLEGMTGALWRSAFVAALFAIHPLRVESVAWVSERKDVLSGVFFMLTVGAYARYARRPGLGRYLAVLLLFALGLMSKSMLVTLPFVLLLLDYWPLGRLELGSKKLLLEKAPLLALSAAACAATILTQKGAIMTVIPFSLRIGNAFVSCLAYILQMVYPARLTIFYPFVAVPLVESVAAVVLLAAITAAAVACRRARPYILTGWLWYLGMLVPVIGLIQVGTQARADRYTYLPQIGLALLVTWLVADLSASWRRRPVLLGGAAGVVIAGFALLAHAQTAYWSDSQTLWEHALACTRRNGMAHIHLGCALFEKGETDAAIPEFQKALEIAPGYAPGYYNLGLAYTKNGMRDAAIAQFQKAVEIQPDYMDALLNLGNALAARGEIDAAVVQYRKALELQPGDEKANYDIGNILFQKGETKDAIAHFEKAIEADPLSVPALNNLAWALATSPTPGTRDGTRAVEVARQALGLAGDDPRVLRTLAAADAQAGSFEDATETAQRALQLTGPSDAFLAGALRREAALYEAGRPYEDAPRK